MFVWDTALLSIKTFIIASEALDIWSLVIAIWCYGWGLVDLLKLEVVAQAWNILNGLEEMTVLVMEKDSGTGISNGSNHKKLKQCKHLIGLRLRFLM